MSTKPPSDAYLLQGAQRRPSDMHTRSGYPIWTLVSVWYARGQSDDALIAEYALDPREWAAAKAYYFAHQPAIDARRALNDEPTPAPSHSMRCLRPAQTIQAHDTLLRRVASLTGRVVTL